IQGIKNEVGAWITPAFPKLLYVTDDNNIHEDSKYYSLTQLASVCVSKRMMPDFISAKHMRQNYEGNVFGCMGCRAWLSPYKGPINNTEGTYKWYGRFNMGLTSLNLADVGLSAQGDLDKFWKILEDRLELCRESLMLRYEKLKNVTSDVSPIHWQHGAIARLKPHEPIYPLLQNGYATITLGYIGLYECVMALIGKSHTTPEGEKLGVEIMKNLKAHIVKWKEETGLGFALYGTPSESLTERFAKCLQRRFGVIKGITDRNYLTNSYHVFVGEEIDAFEKLKFESQFHPISSGGAISYVELPNLAQNPEVILTLIKYMYENVQYAEMNTKLDFCMECGYEGEILCDDNLECYCTNCVNRDKARRNVVRLTCGYLGENYWNEGRTQEIKERVMHL
ncbi:MAG: anaerobic ribonucleoside-triphosphate reductase, partial [Oscillospiraceae bacterium]|nr:anaerobic ribonucleoside-triphosphate reductase [Oscillospiraceae bacterium]